MIVVKKDSVKNLTTRERGGGGGGEGERERRGE